MRVTFSVSLIKIKGGNVWSLLVLLCRLVAYALQALGLEKGSSIAIDMPMTVKSVVIYLAIVLAGYVVVSIADSFAAPEISTRLKISKAKAIFTQVGFLIHFDLKYFHLVLSNGSIDSFVSLCLFPLPFIWSTACFNGNEIFRKQDWL